MLSDTSCMAENTLQGSQNPDRRIAVSSAFARQISKSGKKPCVPPLRDYENRSGRLVRHVFHPFKPERTVDLGPALYVWSGEDGFWLESSKGGFGLPSIGRMRSDAWAGATYTLLRRYEPSFNGIKGVLDYIWQAYFHRVAVTPDGTFEAGSPEAFAALKSCVDARRSGHEC